MDFKEAIINTVVEMFPDSSMQLVFLGVTKQNQFISANQLNVLVGLSGYIEGNAIIGFNKSALPNVLLGMTGAGSISDLNSSTQGMLCKLADMILKNAIEKAYKDEAVKLSLPTVITGQQLFLMISRVESTKINFKIKDEFFNISYSIE